MSACGGHRPGDAASRSEQAQVRQFLPDASQIQCIRRGPRTRCQALVQAAWRTPENWTCEFTVSSNPGQRAYAATQSCWSDNGSRESLRLPSD